ncbi:MAG: OmpH family outer membrane protein [Brevundimonas sp.]
MKTLALAAFGLVSLAASAAAAQTAGPANPGPAIPGVCVYHNERLIAQSTAGQSLATGIQRLVEEVRAELQPYAAAIETEAQALQSGQATIPQAEFEQRRTALQQRIQEAAQLEQTRDNELRYTRGVQLQTIAQAVDPIVVAVYQERGCGILIDRESVYVVNPAMDITDAVIQRLNTQLPTLSFNRLQVPVQQQQPAAAQ